MIKARTYTEAEKEGRRNVAWMLWRIRHFKRVQVKSEVGIVQGYLLDDSDPFSGELARQESRAVVYLIPRRMPMEFMDRIKDWNVPPGHLIQTHVPIADILTDA